MIIRCTNCKSEFDDRLGLTICMKCIRMYALQDKRIAFIGTASHGKSHLVEYMKLKQD